MTPGTTAITEHPRQPLVWSDGVMRFKANPIVVALLEDSQERGRIDMNTIRLWVSEGRATVDDLLQFVQLLGYSVSSMGDLDYVPSGILVEIDQEADSLWKDRQKGE